MEEKNNPLSPHLQIYKWQISSLLSIAHRIVGVINIIAITIICFWSLALLLGEEGFSMINNLLTISRNVIYKNLDNIMRADVIEINTTTKDTKIFMYNSNKQVNVTNIK